MCGPYYVGDTGSHMANHAGYMVKIANCGFEFDRDWLDLDSAYLAPHITIEEELGLR